jgi:CBS domain-containing protein
MKAPNLDLKAREVMNTRLMAVNRRAIGRDMAVHLLAGGYSGLPVLEREGELIGLVTEFDLLKAVLDGKDLHRVTAEEIMSVVPVTVDEDTPAKEVMHHMMKWNILRVPVVRHGKLVGMISRPDLLQKMVESHLICVLGGS